MCKNLENSSIISCEISEIVNLTYCSPMHVFLPIISETLCLIQIYTRSYLGRLANVCNFCVEEIFVSSEKKGAGKKTPHTAWQSAVHFFISQDIFTFDVHELTSISTKMIWTQLRSKWTIAPKNRNKICLLFFSCHKHLFVSESLNDGFSSVIYQAVYPVIRTWSCIYLSVAVSAGIK